MRRLTQIWTLRMGDVLSGGDCVVVADECHVTRRQCDNSRVVATRKKCILGGADTEPTKDTNANGDREGGRPTYVDAGRRLLAEIPGRAEDTSK